MKYLIALGFTLISTMSYGFCMSGGCVGKPQDLFVNYTIEHRRSEGIHFLLENNIFKEVLNCNLDLGVYLVLPKSHPNYQEIYSTVLFAHANDMRISLQVKHDEPTCTVDHLIVTM